MSSAWKAVKKGVKSATKRIKGALKGDLSDLTSVATLGVSDQLKNAGKAVSGAVSDALLPEVDIPTAEELAAALPEPPPTPGAVQTSIQGRGPQVDLSATEGVRRRSGSAKGSRKLRLPIGGLRR